MAAITGGRVTVQGVGNASLQGDRAFCDVLRDMGCRVEQTAHTTTVQGPSVPSEPAAASPPAASVGDSEPGIGSSGEHDDQSELNRAQLLAPSQPAQLQAVSRDFNPLGDTFMTAAVLMATAQAGQVSIISNIANQRLKEVVYTLPQLPTVRCCSLPSVHCFRCLLSTVVARYCNTRPNAFHFVLIDIDHLRVYLKTQQPTCNTPPSDVYSHRQCDRIAAVAHGLQRLGVMASARPDGLAITGCGPNFKPRPAIVRCHGDHRMAMSFAVLGCMWPNVAVDDRFCVSKTNPAFWAQLRCDLGISTASIDRPVKSVVDPR